MDFSIILLLPNGLNVGFNYFPANEEFNYEEYNIYLLFIQLKWRYYEIGRASCRERGWLGGESVAWEKKRSVRMKG